MPATTTTTTTTTTHRPTTYIHEMDCTKQGFCLVMPAPPTNTAATTTSTRSTAYESASARTSSQGTATINYLPSFSKPCKNVPTRTTTATTPEPATAPAPAPITTATTKLFNETVHANGRFGGSSCCCHRWEHENDYFYEKHAMTPSLTGSRQLPQQPNKHDSFSLSHQQRHHQHYNNNNNNNNSNSYFNNSQHNYYNNSAATRTTNMRATKDCSRSGDSDGNGNGNSGSAAHLVLVRKQQQQQQRYNELLSAFHRAHNTYATIATTTTTTRKSFNTLATADACANAAAAATRSRTAAGHCSQSAIDLTTRNDVRLLNYATRKFIKSRTHNSNNNALHLNATNAGTQAIIMPIVANAQQHNTSHDHGDGNCVGQRLVTAQSIVAATACTARCADNASVTRNFMLATEAAAPTPAQQLTTPQTTNRTCSRTTDGCSNDVAGNGHFGDTTNDTDTHADTHTPAATESVHVSGWDSASGSESGRCNSNLAKQMCDAVVAHGNCPMTNSINTTTTTYSIFDVIIYFCYYMWLACHRRHLWHSSWQRMAIRLRITKTFPPTKWLLCALLLMLTTSANCYARQDAPTNCTFPARWEGSWFLSGYQQSIHIKGSQFSYRGKCAASDGNKYLIVDEKGCHRCLVIYEKHKNVLQYKESECEGDSIYMHQSNPSALAMRSVLKQTEHRGGAHPNINGHSRLSSSDQYIMRSNDDMNDCPPDFCKGRETLQNLCDQIPGDALLYSLFRESAEPVKCPLKGPFVFTYNRGHGECKNPVSNIESCTEESRLLLSFQACPDVQGTESTVEELTCLATWKDGNSRYLVGLVSHHHAISNEERYRCFVYEKISPLMGGPSLISSKDAEYKLAQSGDATCNGLDSAEVGSRIMSLRKPPLAERCDFPVWFKGPRHWHGLMGNSVYNYHSNDGSIHIIKPNGYMETRALCEQINKQTSTEMMAVVHYTTGCQSGFMCMMFYRRDTHVIEIQTGRQAARLEDACALDYFDIHKMPYITLLASNPEQQICPMEGLYNLRGAIGPPYMTTRHKRNHNNKLHMAHAHHHQLTDESNTNVHGLGLTHKRHSTLSFRNGDKNLERSSWHANTRGVPVRSRRNTPVADDNQHVVVASGNTELLLKDTKANETAIDLILRNRRNVPGCITNVKAQRQLWIGCTDHDIIDVRPLCNDDGDEVYSCHGSWSENGTVHIIARHKSTKHGVCISYRPTEGTAAKLYIGDTCYRGAQKVPDHILEANLSVFGKCGETGSSSKQRLTANWSLLTAVLLITTLVQVYAVTAVHR